MDPHLLSYLSHSPAETRQHAARVCENISEGAIILLEGDLGAGKTEWVKGFVEHAGNLENEESVSSPTFALLHVYSCKKWKVFHWDLYRLSRTTDWSVLDLDEQLKRKEGVILIEWPERYPHSWPAGTWRIRFEEVGADVRRIVITHH